VLQNSAAAAFDATATTAQYTIHPTPMLSKHTVVTPHVYDYHYSILTTTTLNTGADRLQWAP
jgi:hypothetical protein